MSDLTIIYLTEDRLPIKWLRYQREVLLKAVDGFELVTISRSPLDMGLNLIQTEPRSILNIYKQMLIGAKAAKTKYIAIAEDDCLYPASHFKKYRPKKNVFAYNLANWRLYNWGEPVYHSPGNTLNYALIASRELVISSLEKRFELFGYNPPPEIERWFGELGRKRVGKHLEIKEAKIIGFYTVAPIINIHTDMSFDPLSIKQKKPHKGVRCYSVPMWGEAKDIIRKFA